MREPMEQHAARHARGAYMAARHGNAANQAANLCAYRIFAARLFADANGGQYSMGYAEAFDDAWSATRTAHRKAVAGA